MSRNRYGLSALLLVAALLASGCNPVDPLGVAEGAAADYEWTDGKFEISSDSKIAVAVVDRRAYVLNGEKPPAFTGLVRQGYGVPYDAVTESRRSLAEDFAISIVAGLQGAGIEAQAPTLTSLRSMERSHEDLMRVQADRYALLILNEWKTDTYWDTGLAYSLELTVLGPDGAERLRKEFVGKDEGSSGAFTPKGRNAQVVLQLYPAKLKEVFEDPDVAAALQ